MASHPKIKGEPTDEKMIQDYVSYWYAKRYGGTGYVYHSKVVKDMLGDSPISSKILDVGCGTGFVSELYPGLDITGIDISDGMLEKNKHKWVKGSAEEIPFPDNHFDLVVCRSLLHHLEEPAVGLKEMFRVLKPGGRWVCWDPNQSLLNNTFRKLFQRTERFSHLHKSFMDTELFSMIEGAGFRIEQKKYIGYLAYPLCGFPDIHDFKLHVWLGLMLMRLDEAISQTPLKRFAWSLMVSARKP